LDNRLFRIIVSFLRFYVFVGFVSMSNSFTPMIDFYIP
jgi:hypothetical protein